ncbi:DUF3794 domain-containing protein [Sporomusa aerivorans]|uniref:DUF3794 domain-containing protein n=1 Tax=Sporomusa aerivorans TaxID=204936 RepID=UPI00352BC30A
MSFCNTNCQKECKATIGNVECTMSGKFERPSPCECEMKDHLLIINGICPREQLENFLDCGDIRRWTQIFVPEVLCIPSQKPDIEQLVSISAVVEIISQQIVRTPGDEGMTFTNEECTDLTGKKLIIEGVLQQKIVYAAAVDEQSVHSVHFDVPFSAFIVLSPKDPRTRKFKIDVCIEDIFVSDITPRKIFKNVTLVIRALPIICPEICK